MNRTLSEYSSLPRSSKRPGGGCALFCVHNGSSPRPEKGRGATRSKYLIIAAVALLCLSSIAIVPSDGSDAASDVPTLDVRDLDGNSLSGKGAILDDATLDVRTDTVAGNRTTYSVYAGDALVDGSLYLIVENAPDDTYSLSGYVFNFNDTAKLFGLRFSLYTDRDCSGTPVASTVFNALNDNERIFADGLRDGVRYYIKVDTVNSVTSDRPFSIGGIGFGFTASLDSEYHAVYYVSDGETVSSTILRNGSHYIFPEISKEGCTLIGWYDSPEFGTLYRESDVVDLDGDLYLYAFWWEGGSESATYRTLDGTEVVIRVEVGETVTVSVNAVTADGKMSVDVRNWDVSQRIARIPVMVELADGEVFTGYDAERCVDIVELIAVWFEGRSLDIVPSVAFDRTDISINADALGILSDNGFWLNIGSGTPNICFDNTAVRGIVGPVPDPASTYRFIIRESSVTDLTPEQIKAVHGDPCWSVSVVVDNTEVHGIGGTITITVPYAPEHDDPRISVRWVSPVGDLTEVPSAFDADSCTVTFSTDHLSVYSVHADYKDSQDELLPWLLLVSLAMILSVLVIHHIRKN